MCSENNCFAFLMRNLFLFVDVPDKFTRNAVERVHDRESISLCLFLYKEQVRIRRHFGPLNTFGRFVDRDT